MTERRDFIKKGLIGTAGIAIGGMGLSAKSYASVVGANERINLAVIGIRGQGNTHIAKWCALKENRNVFLKTICDVDEELFADRAQKVEEEMGVKPVIEWDMRSVFDDKDIHAVSFATPNHWHALGSIWAAQAGKHVYVEKPASHNVFEGRKMVEAAHKYNVRMQVGFQNRSIKNVIEAMEFLRFGGIGEVYLAKGMCYKPRDSFGISPDGMPPESLHYDMWLGPATWRPYNEKRGHYNWHWHWNTGGGDTANQGPHQFDIARWGLQKNEHPESVYSTGGLYGINPKECSQETPNTQTSIFKYADGKVLEFETRGRYTNSEGGLEIKIGNIFYGTEGYLEVNGSSWQAFRQRERLPFASSQRETSEVPTDPTFRAAPGGTEHYANFVDAIRSGRNYDLNCDINTGFYSSALPALANISYRLKRELYFVGSYEKFADDPEADMLLSRNYRKPYFVPDEV
jgi:predicted dehydrogenase